MEPVRLPSRVTEVEVFRSGARVVRSAELPEGQWPEEVVIDGLPLALEDGSVRVTARGAPGAALPWPSDVRVLLVLPEPGETLEPPAERELLAAGDEVARVKTRLARIEREAARLDKVQPRLPEPFANRPPRPAPSAAWRGTIAWLERRRAELLEEKLAAAEELRVAAERQARLARARDEERARRDARADGGVSKAVALRLRGPRGGSGATLHVEYQVPGAFWAPAYTFRIARNGRTADLCVRALVAQRSGEPWTGVALKLSTADRHREAELPDLPSLRIGRSQEMPPRPAWRPLPEGYEELFAGFDAALSEKPGLPPPPGQAAARALEVTGAVRRDADEERAAPRTKRAARPEVELPPMVFAAAPAPPPPPAPAAAPAPRGAMASISMPPGAGLGAGLSMADMMRTRAAPAPSDDGFAGAVPECEPPEMAEAPEPSPAAGRLEVGGDALRYGDLTLTAWDEPAGARGRLKKLPIVKRMTSGLSDAERSAVARRLVAAEAAAGEVARALPSGARPVAESAGAFDTRYVAEGPVDVPGDGRLHVVALLSRQAPVKTLLVAVPREGKDAVRIAVLANPLRVPLLEGPADVYLEDELLVTSPLRTVPAGGELTLGLGVEERLKVARNVRYAEEAHGMLGGSTTLDHRVSIEVASRLPDPVEVEVRERVPLKEETDRAIEVVVSDVSPPWSDFDQAPAAPVRGGKRWRFSLGAGESRTLAFRYRIRIDAKDELVGGNRREPA